MTRDRSDLAAPAGSGVEPRFGAGGETAGGPGGSPESGPAGEAAAHDALRSIQEAAALLGITQRTLRFYEDNGLIAPARIGGSRIYSRRDIARMQLILRGKRLGFSIREIAEFLDLYDADPDQREQTELLLARVRQRITGLTGQRAAIEETLRELRAIESEASEALSAKS